jgi:fatty-acyl-CoA synthase
LKVSDLVHNEIGLNDANIDVVDGGAHGMCVTVTVAEGDQLSVPALEQALAAYLFETRVQVV